jgi:tetratricopeptide (TPR) repeat protein
MEKSETGNKDKLFLKALRGRQEVYGLIGQNSMGLADCEKALSFCRKRIRSRTMESRLMLDLAEGLRLDNKYRAAKKITTEALKHIDRKKSKNEYARCLNLLGMVNDDMGDYDSPLQYYQKAVRINEETQNKAGIASATNNIGLYYWTKGDLENALSHFKKALKVWKEANNRVGIGVASGNLGIAYCSMGDLNKGLKYFLENLEVSQEINHKVRIVIALGNVGVVYCEKGEFEKARDLYQKALALSTEMSNEYEIGFAHLYLGEVDCETGALLEAKQHLEKARKTFKGMNDTINLAAVYIALSAVHRKAKDYRQSLKCAQEAVSLSKKGGAKEKEIGALRELAKIVTGDDPGKAVQLLERSISIAEKEKMSLELAKSCLELATMQRMAGKNNDAEKNMDEARRIFKKADAHVWLKKINGL